MGAKALCKRCFEVSLDGRCVERKRADPFEEDVALAPDEAVEIDRSPGNVGSDERCHRGMTGVRNLDPIVSARPGRGR